MTAARTGVVSFVGAGPGDPELVTLKALRRLRAAEVVVHDRLVPPALLAEVAAGAEVIDGGKAGVHPDAGQDRINALLVDRGRRGRRVVRLKGGDPTVFGRLNEEIRAVRAAGLPFEIVPGVTAATAAAAAAGLSLTERGVASAVVLAAGADRTAAETPALDWACLARLDATLVFYMPVRRLAAIAGALTALGRDPREPALVVAAAGTPAERLVPGDLARIADAAGRARVEAPAVLITGPVAGRLSRPPAAPPTLAARA